MKTVDEIEFIDVLNAKTEVCNLLAMEVTAEGVELNEISVFFDVSEVIEVVWESIAVCTLPEIVDKYESDKLEIVVPPDVPTFNPPSSLRDEGQTSVLFMAPVSESSP